MARLEVRVEFEHNGVLISASTLAREITQVTRLRYQDALLIVAIQIRNRMQSQSSLWPKPPTPPHIKRQRTGLSQAGMRINVVGKTVTVTNDVYYARYVNYARVFPNTGIPNWNYLAVERTLARDWFRIRKESHRVAQTRGAPRKPSVSQPGRGFRPIDGWFLPVLFWDEEEEEEQQRRTGRRRAASLRR